MVSILKIADDDDLQNAVDTANAYLRSGGVIVYPTDTVYGIGCDANSREALAKVHKIKRIAKEKPFSVMMSDIAMIEGYCDIGPGEEMILSKYLPGPYTFLLKSKGLCPASNNEKLGVRIPDSRICQALCAKLDRPIVTTSANMTGGEPPARFEDIDKKLIEAVGVAIDEGETKHGGPSVIIDLVERKMIREGGESMDLDELLRIGQE
jgi:L-threonylcarbamoyladenylate synthase